MPRVPKDGGLAKVRAYPLSDADIRKVLGPDIPIITNRELAGVRSLDDVFDSKGRMMLLYTPEDPTSGHWVCLMRYPDHILYWDSYGDKPDGPLDLGDQPPTLTRLLKEAGVPVFYNTKQYQRLRGEVATCGRWCVLRLLYKDKSPREFDGIVKRFDGEGDDFVSALIYDFIGK